LASSATQGNQWFLNGNPIPGATGQFYSPTENGFYSVQTNDNGCLSDMSQIINFTLTDTSETFDGKGILVYPNPAKDRLQILYDVNRLELKTAVVFDMVGRMVDVPFENGGLQLAGMQPGVYYLKVMDAAGKLVGAQSFVKMD
jgi:hypothetical protein